MWDIIIALVLMYPDVEMADEWQRDRAARRLLSQMREHVEQRHRWDVTRGQWVT
jgi:hypothetical protein